MGRLSTMPGQGKQTDIAGIRALVVPRRPYIIFYRLDEKQIEVVRIFDGRRSPDERPDG